MGRRSTVLVAVAVALVGLAVGVGLDLVDDGDEAASAPPAADPCLSDPPLVAVDGTDQIASGLSHVLVVRPDGARARATPDDWVATEPDVDPSGSRLVVVRADGDYESAGPGSTALWTLGLDGSDPVPVTAGEWYDSSPRWSPDGATIALVRTSYDDAVEPGEGPLFPVVRVVVVAAGGSEPRELARADGGTSLVAPEWSPDGSRLAYVRRERDPSGRPAAATLWTVGADGSGAVEVGPVEPATRSIDWHPDGDRLLVSSLPSSSSGSMALVDLATGTSTVLSRGATWGRWSRGGTHVVHHTQVGEVQTTGWSLVERPLDGTTLGPTRDLAVDTGFFYDYYGLSVAPCA